MKARDEFLSVAAHELKTPLTSLRIHAQTLLRQLDRAVALPTSVGLERSLRIVDRQINRLSRLVTTLVETVRPRRHGSSMDRKQRTWWIW